MKIGIITIVDPNPNYGNRLQNYASQNILSRYGAEVITYAFEKDSVETKETIKYYMNRLTGFRFCKNNLEYWKSRYPRAIKFKKFNLQYIKIQFCQSLDEVKDTCDFYAVGSDQVWNASWYSYYKYRKELYLLTFTEPEKKVCMAPSFGVEKLPEEWNVWFQKNLPTFPYLSVREKAGKNIIKELTGQEAEVLIDPTMMLDKDDWMKIAKKPLKIEVCEPYILTYFIGGRSERVNNDLKKYEKKYSMRVYNLLDISQKDLSIIDPSEFIYLLAHAKLVLTDSFHACVFSFLFQKPFLVYPREGKENRMMSRIFTLLEMFDMERKYVDSNLKNEIFEADYKIGYARLKEERNKMDIFLKQNKTKQKT